MPKLVDTGEYLTIQYGENGTYHSLDQPEGTITVQYGDGAEPIPLTQEQLKQVASYLVQNVWHPAECGDDAGVTSASIGRGMSETEINVAYDYFVDDRSTEFSGIVDVNGNLIPSTKGEKSENY